MQKILLLILCLYSFLLSGFIFAQDSNTIKNPAFSVEYFNRLVLNESVYLWNALPSFNDELGYKSLKQEEVVDGSDISSREDKVNGLVVKFDNLEYKITDFQYCSTLSQAASKIKKLFKNQALCAFDIRNSTSYIIIIGQNNNEILKEIKESYSKKDKLIPSWYDFKVKE